MKSSKEILEATAFWVQENLQADITGHDWWHVNRVWHNAKELMRGEDVDHLIVELAALLHDIGDYKLHDNVDRSHELISPWLKEQGVSDEIIDKVCRIINEISFKGAGAKCELTSREAEIVQDADRLDAIGAIGIARAFTFGGHLKQRMHDPKVDPAHHKSFEEYKDIKTTTINHFYEKLLLLKDSMNTGKAKVIATGRYKYMRSFLDQFHMEWKGKK